LLTPSGDPPFKADGDDSAVSCGGAVAEPTDEPADILRASL
jgi:hypothetical protein